MIDLTISLGKITFQNPIFAASGTFGYGVEVPELVDVNKLGAIITKSVTLEPREGNPPPRIVETPSGMINSIGLANIGIKKFISEMVPVYENFKTKIILNIAGSTMDEYVSVLESIESISSVIAGYEINISCPNVKQGGMEFGVNSGITERLTEKLRNRTEKLLIMKLSPNVADIAAIARAAEEGGADAVSAINTVVGMSINPHTFKAGIYTNYGGLSGPAIKPIGLAAVHKIFHSIKIPIIGIGGIVSSFDALEYFLAGSRAVQIGTANFRNPSAALEITKGLRNILESKNIKSIEKIIGKVVTFE
ncbi:MAG: dihydroorotate dehydrogenase [Candidatus Neomarinimicrobiota bacterium]